MQDKHQLQLEHKQAEAQYARALADDVRKAKEETLDQYRQAKARSADALQVFIITTILTTYLLLCNFTQCSYGSSQRYKKRN